MLMIIGGLARTLGILLAIVAAFVAIGTMNVPLLLVVLGLVAGLAMPEERLLLAMATVIALPIVGGALSQIPAIGAQLNAVALNLQMAMAGAVATAIAIKLFHLAMEGAMGVMGGAEASGRRKAART
ncbi:hypothetical protein LZ519_01515 [Sphingomonas sp. RG327]|jgi:hypothetical protein|uniref:Uncharacterized protein n=1 Tax=Sphingomonas anseongensis TaxID=2908207 RepID=A0ABT0RCN1_9SPHN|nr:hypothetical protein [Sphingomonas anseongensis]MCL6678001.1 hypothetical protein [Sphingomonas anseongensis]